MRCAGSSPQSANEAPSRGGGELSGNSTPHLGRCATFRSCVVLLGAQGALSKLYQAFARFCTGSTANNSVFFISQARHGTQSPISPTPQLRAGMHAIAEKADLVAMNHELSCRHAMEVTHRHLGRRVSVVRVRAAISESTLRLRAPSRSATCGLAHCWCFSRGAQKSSPAQT